VKKRIFSVSFVLLLVLSIALGACAPKPAALPGGVAQTAFKAMKVEAPNCDYGGEFKSIEAVDEFTVKFTMCNPDPAFPSKVAFSVFNIQDKDFMDANQGDSVKMGENANGTARMY
jgi:ABC-type oligopeptide transport system substrate-binding subunit